jgi:preprotein translocase subunit SecD
LVIFEERLPTARVYVEGERIFVELPTLPPADRIRARALLGKRARLSFVRVDGSKHLQRLAVYADMQKEYFPGLEESLDSRPLLPAASEPGGRGGRPDEPTHVSFARSLRRN